MSDAFLHDLGSALMHAAFALLAGGMLWVVSGELKGKK